MTYGIEIDNGEKKKCPNCNSIFAIENKSQVLYRNITLLHFDHKEQKSEIKCKQCKSMITVNLSSGRIVVE